MGRHDAKDGISFLHTEETELRKQIRIILHKCCKVAMHSGTHVGATVALHVVALYVLGLLPLAHH